MSGATIDRLLTASPEQRRLILTALSPEERAWVADSLSSAGPRWGRWVDDPVGFVTDALGETLWSKQREILESIRDHKRTAVPACHAPGKSHIAARAVAWWVACHPPGTARVVTTASTFRQVRNVLWPHIRRVARRHGLPGDVLTVEWKLDGNVVADGFSPADHDEAAVQGIHAPHLLVVVDEAGGLGPTLGRALEALMTGGHTRLLVLGNPPVDAEQGWFESVCNSSLYNVIPISAYDTPNFTGEDAGPCHACPPEVEPHSVAIHLVDSEWVEDVTAEFGPDSPFVQARVFARFPKGAPNKVLPLQWVETAVDNPAATQGPIRLGVDIASDGGDEFVVAWADGMIGSIRYHAAGAVNQNAVDVAAVVLAQIQDAERVHEERGLDEQVRVKVDTIGVGWGVVSMLQRWGEERRHRSLIVPVNVAERPRDTTKFASQRAEMWWNMRGLLQPRPGVEGPMQDARLTVSRREIAQLTAPLYKADSAGRIVVEQKAEMKRRGVSSPDRAEALLLAFFEPPTKQAAPVVAPVGLGQKNPWAM
jgi:hypothetical protein